MPSPTLKPCPFCGGEAEVATGTDRLGYWWSKAYCRLCRAGIMESYNPKRDWVTVDDGDVWTLDEWIRMEAGPAERRARNTLPLFGGLKNTTTQAKQP